MKKMKMEAELGLSLGVCLSKHTAILYIGKLVIKYLY